MSQIPIPREISPENDPRDHHVSHAFVFKQLHLGQPELHGSEDPQHLAVVRQAACQGKTPHLPRFDATSWLVLQAAC